MVTTKNDHGYNLFWPFTKMAAASFLLSIVPFLPATEALKVNARPDNFHYHVLDSSENVLFKGGDIAFFVAGQWCVHKTTPKGMPEPAHRTLVPQSRKVIRGTEGVLGKYAGESVFWTCQLDATYYEDGEQGIRKPRAANNSTTNSTSGPLVRIVTTYKNMKSENAVLFEVEWPEGAPYTQVKSSYKSAMTNYPSLRYSTRYLPDALSWQGSFIQSVRGFSEGTEGGPTVFYNASDPNLEYVIIGSPWGGNWKSFSAGYNHDWKGEFAYWAPGTSGRIQQLPKRYKQSILLYQREGWAHPGGITATMASWGRMMQNARSANSSLAVRKVPDVTLQKIGYQTDNGAMYCFCSDKNCSNTLIQEVKSLSSQGIPMGYLSFQGAGSSSGRGKAAPWCVETWGVDGGLSQNYPMDLKSFQKALGVPLQLYAPYFCPGSSYFESNNQNSQWKSISSDPSLPGCSDFNFENVEPSQSRAFYDWFLDKGIEHAGMKSFETDFMNQNYNCVPNFVHDANAATMWQQGMAGAALNKSIPIQWCYANPTDALASLDMPAVTNFRVSFDFCYGKSWNIGESSLLVWAVGAAPSKDTLWTTDNNRTEIPGCSWTSDHENSAAELHGVLALMSTGPVGISDAIGFTNTTLLKRIISKDGTLLKPTKPITAVDSTFLDVQEDKNSQNSCILASPMEPGSDERGMGGYVYGTAGMGPSWIFVSFLLPFPYQARVRDFWPSLPRNGSISPIIIAYRHFNSGGASCQNGTHAVSSGCVKLAHLYTQDKFMNRTVLEVPAAPLASSGKPGYTPTVTTAWQACHKSGWILLGELDKYVPLSPQRFQTVSCTKDGVSVSVNGSHNESIELTALRPTPVGLTSYSMGRKETCYTVIKKKVSFSDTGQEAVSFSGPSSYEDDALFMSHSAS